MKSVIVKVQIQFDIFPKSNDKAEIQEEIGAALQAINSVLQKGGLDCSPSMFVNNVDESDIEVVDEEIEDKEIEEGEIEEFIKKFGSNQKEVKAVEGFKGNSSAVSEMAINFGYVWIEKHKRWVNKDNSFFTERDEEILDFLTD